MNSSEQGLAALWREGLIDNVLLGIQEEVLRQDERWGEQHHPAHGGADQKRGQASADVLAESWKTSNARRVEDGTLGWDGILYEEAYEAFAETDVDRQCAELVQVAAVAVNAILSLRRNASRGAA